MERSQSVLTNRANIRVNNHGGKNNISNQQRWQNLCQQPTESMAHVLHQCALPVWPPLLLPSHGFSRPCFPAQKKNWKPTHSSPCTVQVRTTSLRSHPYSQTFLSQSLMQLQILTLMTLEQQISFRTSIQEENDMIDKHGVSATFFFFYPSSLPLSAFIFHTFPVSLS